jgi:hypothetical protein
MKNMQINSLKLNNAEVLRQELKDLFPDSLPRAELTPFNLGVLVGQQQVLDKINELLNQEES